MAKSQEPDSGDEDLTPPDDKAEDDDNINPFTKPQSPANGSPPPTSSQADGSNIVNASTEPQLSTNNGSPPPSSEASKPKFKVGRCSKEDQEDWNKFTEDVDNMLLKYAKTKNMPMEQAFTQYSTLKKRFRLSVEHVPEALGCSTYRRGRSVHTSTLPILFQRERSSKMSRH